MVLDYSKSNITLSTTEQLYTARGAQAIGVSKNIALDYMPNIDDWRSTMLVKDLNFGYNDAYYQKRVLWSTD